MGFSRWGVIFSTHPQTEKDSAYWFKIIPCFLHLSIVQKKTITSFLTLWMEEPTPVYFKPRKAVQVASSFHEGWFYLIDQSNHPFMRRPSLLVLYLLTTPFPIRFHCFCLEYINKDLEKNPTTPPPTSRKEQLTIQNFIHKNHSTCNASRTGPYVRQSVTRWSIFEIYVIFSSSGWWVIQAVVLVFFLSRLTGSERN